MDLDRYYPTTDHSHTTYEFLSEGPRGTIKKVVLYDEIEDGVFNLAFGDWDEKNEEIRDDTRTNNADRDKVLATVASGKNNVLREKYIEEILLKKRSRNILMKMTDYFLIIFLLQRME